MFELPSFLKNNMTQRRASWQRYWVNDYLVMQVCAALEKIGVFDILLKGGATIEELSSKLGAKKELLGASLEFLYAVTDFLEKKENYFILKQQDLSQRVWATLAYKPVLDNLADLLIGRKLYGSDVERDGYYLQKSSNRFSSDAVGKVIDIIGRESAFLVDLGCGSAESLIRYCKLNPAGSGMGIDINQVIVDEARNLVSEAGLSGRISIVKIDVLHVERWVGEIPQYQKIVFLASAVLHEFLQNGDGVVIDFLKRIKKTFPLARLFLIEFDALSFDAIREEKDQGRKLFAAMYALWHHFSYQGKPQPRYVWEKIITAGNWNIQNIIPAENYLLIYDCR